MAELDHIPSRALFRHRQWPEGYIFPACVRCNRATRHDEEIVALLSRAYIADSDSTDQADMRRLMTAIARNRPEILFELRPTSRQVRTAVRNYGFPLPPGAFLHDLPLLSVSGPLVNSAVLNFSRKLFCALYYKHTGQILARSAGIAILWFSNLQIGNEEIPRELEPVLNQFPKLERSRRNLQDQFCYRYGIDNGVAGFLVFFQRSFATLGFISEDARNMQLPEDAKILRPFDWREEI